MDSHTTKDFAVDDRGMHKAIMKFNEHPTEEQKKAAEAVAEKYRKLAEKRSK